MVAKHNGIKANQIAFKKSAIILKSMVVRNVKTQYRRSVLGILWTVLNPLLNMVVMALVFSKIFGRGLSGLDYPVYVLSGNVVFGIMRMATSGALPCIVDNYDLLTKTRIPHAIFPISHVLSSVVNFLFSMIALIIVMLIRIPKGVHFYPTMLMVTVPFLPAMMMFSLGISFILCTVYVRFRDIKHLYGVVLTLWCYLTPLFYAPTILSENMQKAMQFNPMYYFVEYFRDVVMRGIVPGWQTHLILYGVSIAFMVLGFMIFKANSKKIILYI